MPPITITVRNNGSLFITGEDAANIRLVDHEGNEISIEGKKNVALCRCGASSKKPFCDGMHSKIGFKGAEEARKEFDAQQGQPGEHPSATVPVVAAAAPQVSPEGPQTAP